MLKDETQWQPAEQEPGPPSYNDHTLAQAPSQSISVATHLEPSFGPRSSNSRSSTISTSSPSRLTAHLQSLSQSLSPTTAAPTTLAKTTPSSNSIRICTVALAGGDKIRLIGTPSYLTPEIRSTIQMSWGTVQKESSYAGSHEFKLTGHPWKAEGPDLIRCRKLILGMVETMARMGWDLILSTDISQRDSDQDTMFFELNQAIAAAEANDDTQRVVNENILGPLRPVNVEMFAICFHKSDKIRVLAMSIHQAQKVLGLVKQAIASQWKYTIQRERDYCGASEIKLQGNPFWSGGDEFVQGRMVLAQTLANLRAEGYKVYSSVSSGPGSDDDQVDFWIFRRVDIFWSG
ncbi:hypothetical protein BGZ83_005709 [Gryganskiella cystojenkinii]|nr:hypothetical protein BGZ83_005709 [Gryganskiella cystojenkinii]